MLKTAGPPGEIAPGWAAGTTHTLTRCVRRSYRLELMLPGAPCLLWLSGRHLPGVHALGTLTDRPRTGAAGPEVTVRLTLLPAPVARAELLADPDAQDAEVLRMPAGSNPSWLSPRQYAAVLARLGPMDAQAGLGAWSP